MPLRSPVVRQPVSMKEGFCVRSQLEGRPSWRLRPRQGFENQLDNMKPKP